MFTLPPNFDTIISTFTLGSKLTGKVIWFDPEVKLVPNGVIMSFCLKANTLPFQPVELEPVIVTL